MTAGWDQSAFAQALADERAAEARRGGRNVYPIRSEIGVDDWERPPDSRYEDEVEPMTGNGPMMAGASASPRVSTFYSAATLKDRAIPPREWLVDEMIPHKAVTLFGGDGGTGKSLLALQLCVASVAGTAWAGRSAKRGAALMISAEDDDDELHRRLDDILRAEGQTYDDVAGLTLRSLAGEDALLAVESAVALTTTTLFAELEARAAQDAPGLIVIDTLADVYPANENDRAKVRQFVGILRGLALRQKCAVVLLAHPSLAGLNSGSGTSGSTAWNNSVRGRLYLSRVVSDGHEPDTRKRVLSTKKQNYGPTDTEISLTWQDGVFLVDAAETSLDRMAGAAKGERVFMKLLRAFEDQGRYVSAQPGPTFAPTVFAKHPEAEGMTKNALRTAMDNALTAGRIRIATHGTGVKARSHLTFGEGK